MKKLLALWVVFMLNFLPNPVQAQTKNAWSGEIKKAEKVLDDLNLYASNADFTNYFALYADDSVFIGTDATEIWKKKEFMEYAKPHFDKGKAWNFKALKRNLQVSKDGKFIWFDELLDTQMKLCRGSGVLQKMGKDWKIRQYVLSMTVPNEVTTEVVKAKADIEDVYILNLGK